MVKYLIYLMVATQILLMAGSCYLFHEMGSVYVMGLNNRAENTRLRQDVEYLTHPEVQQNRMIDYLHGAGKFK